MNQISIPRIETLLQRHTAFASVPQVREITAGGYVPTIYTRSADGRALPEKMELIAGLRALGVKVWIGSNG
jgi:hypothetical protein